MIYILSLGSNIGDRFEHIKKAILSLSEYGKVEKISSYYESDAIGPSQADFINICLIYKYNNNPEELLNLVKSIEKKLGRRKTTHWGPRVIDIDIIFSKKIKMNTEKLTIPHKELKKRKFVLIPLLEISPEIKIDKHDVAYWLDKTQDKSQVKLIHSF